MSTPPPNPPVPPSGPPDDDSSTHGSPRSTHSTPRSTRSTASRRVAASPDAVHRIARLEDELASAYASRSTMIRDRAHQDDTTEVSDLQQSAQGQGPQLIQGLRDQIALQATEIQDLDRQLTRAQANLATANADRDRLDHQLDLAAADISDLRSQVSGQERELDEVNHELDLTRGSLDRVQTALQVAEATVAQRGHVAAAATVAVPNPTPPTGPTPAPDQLQAALHRVNEELDLMRTARDTARDKATAAGRDVDQAHQDRDAALRENADLRSCVESAQQVIRAQDAQFLDVQNAYAMLRHASDRSSEDLQNVADTLSRVARWIGLRQCAPITPGRRSCSRSGSPDSTGHIHKRARSAPPSRSPVRSPSPSFSLHGNDEELPAEDQHRQAFWETTHYLPITAAQRRDPIVEQYHRDRRARRIRLGDRWRRLFDAMLPMMRKMWADVDLMLDLFFLQIPVRQRDAVTWYPALIEADTHDPWRNQYRDHRQDHPAQRIPRLRNKFNPNVGAQYQP
ncbi:hypothetical protein PHYSODRAFT_337939 [Phytophthora sojae]|uniref:Autophagy-related protein 16 domain-containing protein n=1 Tax=Phytophthora sojae (strain P6497) TaxID=1094619 RepID=G4ZZJ3_PHYSP|nr:hypothetical protein PHYSODRAFT_337939 [Phytophthora sojae]EGZ11193.1 hypothetical protein PHYSODRAFT_337939 [Phytophthora sojae]|eukprot:XP_009533938.1 hypothetical protein PHYSODRAFT_337939 [Phytophthora sojae]